MQMDAVCQLGQGGGPLHAGHELLHVQAAAQVQRGGQLAIDRVVHDDVHNGAAAVHHGVELVPGAGAVVAAGHLAQKARLPGVGDHIAPGGGGDGLARGPQQGHVPHDDLAADAQLLGQGGGADGLMGFVEPGADPAPALFGGHEEDSLRFFFYHTRFPGPWQVFFVNFAALLTDGPPDGTLWTEKENTLRKCLRRRVGGTGE